MTTVTRDDNKRARDRIRARRYRRRRKRGQHLTAATLGTAQVTALVNHGYLDAARRGDALDRAEVLAFLMDLLANAAYLRGCAFAPPAPTATQRSTALRPKPARAGHV